MQVVHELLSLQIVEVLLSEPTNDSVEIAVNFVKEVGQLLDVRHDASFTMSRGVRSLWWVGLIEVVPLARCINCRR